MTAVAYQPCARSLTTRMIFRSRAWSSLDWRLLHFRFDCIDIIGAPFERRALNFTFTHCAVFRVIFDIRLGLMFLLLSLAYIFSPLLLSNYHCMTVTMVSRLLSFEALGFVFASDALVRCQRKCRGSMFLLHKLNFRVCVRAFDGLLGAVWSDEQAFLFTHGFEPTHPNGAEQLSWLLSGMCASRRV